MHDNSFSNVSLMVYHIQMEEQGSLWAHVIAHSYESCFSLFCYLLQAYQLLEGTFGSIAKHGDVAWQTGMHRSWVTALCFPPCLTSSPQGIFNQFQCSSEKVLHLTSPQCPGRLSGWTAFPAGNYGWCCGVLCKCWPLALFDTGWDCGYGLHQGLVTLLCYLLYSSSLQLALEFP